MTFSPEQTDALKADLNRAHVAQRAQAGRNLSYIEAWWAIAEANRIFGFDAWNRETVDLRQLGEPRLVDGKWRVGYSARVRITVNTSFEHYPPVTIIREGSGFGSGIDKDVDQAHESALKEAESDAMKRALMTFGNPFGLALYDKTQAHVSDGQTYNPDNPPPSQSSSRASGRQDPNSLAQKKRDGVMEAMFAGIDGCIDMVELRQWWKDHSAEIKELPSAWQDAISDRKEARKVEVEIGPASAEMDAAFRGAVGSGSDDRVAGDDHPMAAE